MRLWLADGVEQIGLCEQAEFDAIPGDDASLAWQHRIELRDAWQVDAFVARHFREPGQVHALRGWLARQVLLIHRLADDQVLRQVANELQFGNLRADLYAWRPQVITRAAEASVAVVAPTSAPPPTPARAEVAPEPVAVAPVEQPVEQPVVVEQVAAVEQSAQQIAAQDTLAAMLETAAQEATPFCEECEQAKAREAATSPVVPPTPEEARQDAQAAVLEQAARQAIPFCEVCQLAEAQPMPPPAAAPTPVETAQGAQASVLEQAAKNGTPFCEICEQKP